MHQNERNQVKTLITDLLRQNLQPGTWAWLHEKLAAAANTVVFNTTFVAAPRKTGKAPITITNDQDQAIQKVYPGLSVKHWLTDRLTRVWLLSHLDSSDKTKYFQTIENLFIAAEVNELVALYSALPLLDDPEHWRFRCTEGIRSNIGDVLESIMCKNPYPAIYLAEPAWNQLVLKAFFTEKPVEEIVGLDEKANKELAYILSDYAHERWAAHRSVHPQIWRCTGKFIDEKLFRDIDKVASSENIFEREAALLACNDSSYAPAKQLLQSFPDITQAINSGELTWNSLAKKMKEYVLQ